LATQLARPTRPSEHGNLPTARTPFVALRNKVQAHRWHL